MAAIDPAFYGSGEDLERILKESESFTKNEKCIEKSPFGFKNTEIIPDDGNCLFYAIGIAVGKNAHTVRQEICNFLEKNIYDDRRILKKVLENLDVIKEQQLLYKLTIFDDRKNSKFLIGDVYGKQHNIVDVVNRYITKMRENKVWGGVPEIVAAVILYKRSIVVYVKNDKTYTMYPYPYVGLNNDTIVLFLCKLNEHGRAVHYELLELDESIGLDLKTILGYSFKSKKSVKKSVKKNTKKSVKKNTKKSIKKNTKKSVKKSTKKSVKKSTKKSVKKSTKKSVKKNTKKSVKKNTKKNTKKTAKKSINKV
jgi:hypothetical protein